MLLLFLLCVFYGSFFALFLCFFCLIFFLISYIVYYKCDCSCGFTLWSLLIGVYIQCTLSLLDMLAYKLKILSSSLPGLLGLIRCFALHNLCDSNPTSGAGLPRWLSW